jgi:Carboxypeptidase regulatory-like domain
MSVVGIVLLICVGAAAQELGTAVLNGDVTDPQGAVVGNARVTARNTATDARRVTTSSNAGLFVFNDLIPGQYEVRVDAQGFTPSDASVRLQVGQLAS